MRAAGLARVAGGAFCCLGLTAVEIYATARIRLILLIPLKFLVSADKFAPRGNPTRASLFPRAGKDKG